MHHFRRCFLSKRSSLEHPFEPLRKHDARYDVYAVIALKEHSRSLEYSSAFARVGRRCSSFPITLEELFRAGLEIKNLPENGEFIIISTHLNDEVLTE